MTFITGSEISFVLSGGSANSDPNASLGGLPSNTSVSGAENNLFDNVGTADATEGLIDYRCFYIFNDSLTNSLFNAEIFFESQIDGGAEAQMGIAQSTDLQKISVNGSVTAGSADMIYDGESFNWSWDANVNTWASNLENSLNGLVALSGVSVEHSITGAGVDFFVSFEGDDDNKNHQLIQVDENNFTGSTNLATVKITEGAPINSVAAQIAVDTVAPTGVSFSNPTTVTPISLGTLGPGDGVPIWIRRSTPAGTDPFPNDGFTFRLRGEPF